MRQSNYDQRRKRQQDVLDQRPAGVFFVKKQRASLSEQPENQKPAAEAEELRNACCVQPGLSEFGCLEKRHLAQNSGEDHGKDDHYDVTHYPSPAFTHSTFPLVLRQIYGCGTRFFFVSARAAATKK
jgi:hypothetical protein